MANSENVAEVIEIELTSEMEEEMTDGKGGPNDYQQPCD